MSFGLYASCSLVGRSRYAEFCFLRLGLWDVSLYVNARFGPSYGLNARGLR